MKLLKHTLLALVAMPVMAQETKDSILLNDVVVTGARYETTARNLPVMVTTVDREKLTEHQRTNVLSTLTEQVPGLFVTSRGVMGYGVSTGGSGGISMRGIQSGTGQMLVLIDGHPQYQGVYGHSIGDAYQTMMAEKVEVLRGPASVLYGSNAMGGVINIVTRGMKEDGVRTHVNLGAGSYNTWQADLSNQVRKGRFSSTVALQFNSTNNHRPNMGFEQYGAYAKVGYDLTKHWHLFADVNMMRFNASQPGSLTSPLTEADQWITRGVASIGVENHYRRSNGRISVYDNFGIHKINDGYGPSYNGNKPQKEFFRSKDAVEGASWYQNFNLFAGNSITLGADYMHIYGRAYYTSRATGEIVTTGKRGMQSGHAHCNEFAGYVDVKQDILKWVTINAGVRYDHHSIAGGEWIPQAGVIVHPLRNAEIKAVASKGFRNPTTREMYMYGTANHETLRAERLWNYELSWRHHVLNNALTYGVNIFMLKGDNLIQAVAGKNINTGEIENRGAEFDVAWRINSHWSVNTNHSFLNMKYHIVAAPEYKGYLGANMHYGKWSVAAGLQQICGLFTQVGTTETKENFTLLNATVGYQAHEHVRFWVKGDNLLAQRYEINAGYPMPKATFMAGVNVKF